MWMGGALLAVGMRFEIVDNGRTYDKEEEQEERTEDFRF
jgi:hypothetical protein